MSKRLSYDYVKQVFLEHNLELLEKTYSSGKIPLLCKNNDGYYGYITIGHVTEGKSFMPFSAQNKLTTKNLQIFFDRNDIKAEILFKNYKNCKEKCKFRCSCGKIFYKDLSHIISDKKCNCKKCGHRNTAKQHTHTFDFVKKEVTKHGYKLLQNYYINSKSYLEVEDKDGFKGFITFNAVKNNKTFLKFSVSMNEKYFIFNINNLAKRNKLTSVAIKIFGEKCGENTLVSFRCECGRTFIATKRNFFNNKYCKCEICSNKTSSYERKVINWLDKHNINYIFQKSFKGCRYKNPLPFDFYITNKNILIEVDGEGHYHPINFGGHFGFDCLSAFNDIKQNDEIKTKYCLKNNIKLIRIPYYDIKTNSKYIKTLKNNLLG